LKTTIIWLLIFCWISTQVNADNQTVDSVLHQVSSLKLTNPDSAFFIARNYYQSAQKANDKLVQAKFALELGEILYYLGFFENASQYLLEASAFFEEEKMLNDLAVALSWQATVNQYSRQQISVLPTYKKALIIFSNLRDSLKIAETYGGIGHFYEKTGKADTALYYQFAAMKILHDIKSPPRSLARIYDNIGSLYEDRYNLDSAEYYFRKALEINRKLHDTNGFIVSLNNVGDIYRKRQLYPIALFYTDSALSLSYKNKINYQIRSAHRDMAKLFSLTRDFEGGYFHLDSAYNMYSELLNEESIQRMTTIQALYDTEIKEKQIELLEKDKRYNKSLRLGMIGIAVLFLVIAIMVFYYQRNKIRDSRKIHDHKSQLFEKEERLTRLELKNALLKEEALRTQLENQKLLESELQNSIVLKSQLITSHTLQLIRKNNILETVKKELSLIKKSEKKDRDELIYNLLKTINYDILNDENWENFSHIFSQVHKDFITQLKIRYPALSPSEIRLCSLLKLNLHSHEIATILGVSHDSLRIARYRLRKKLDLEKSDNLFSLLMEI
jgi:tetratricopeptide (TPR) repeat protein